MYLHVREVLLNGGAVLVIGEWTVVAAAIKAPTALAIRAMAELQHLTQFTSLQ